MSAHYGLLAFVLVLVPSLSSAVPLLLRPRVSPQAIAMGNRVRLTFSIELKNAPAGSAFLQRQSASGEFKPFGRLKDLGKRGDLVKGDGIFSARRSLKYILPGSYGFRVVYVEDGIPGRIYQSQPFTLEVSPPGVPLSVVPSDPASVVTDALQGDIICNEVLVRFAASVPLSQTLATLNAIGSVVGRIPVLQLFQVRLPGPCTTDTVDSAISTLTAMAGVEGVWPNAVTIPDVTASALPNDRELAAQHYLDVISVKRVWQRYTTGSRKVPVAVVDDGVNYNHDELGLWSRGGRVIPGGAFGLTDESLGTTDHGTAVAGIIGAKTNNDFGLAGITWINPIISIRSANTTTQMIEAITAAILDMRAKIVVVTRGREVCSPLGEIQNLLGLNPFEAVVDVATDNGALIVASAGNGYKLLGVRVGCSWRDGMSIASVSDTLTVGASNPDGTVSSFSNFGAWVDIFAPGRDIRTLGVSDDRAITHSCQQSCSPEPDCDVCGTSIAAPIVAGAAALLWSLMPDEWSPLTVRDYLVDGITPENDPPRLNLLRAVELAVGRCGNDIWEAFATPTEECDGSDDSQCRGMCRVDCTCQEVPSEIPTSTATETPTATPTVTASAVASSTASLTPGSGVLLSDPALSFTLECTGLNCQFGAGVTQVLPDVSPIYAVTPGSRLDRIRYRSCNDSSNNNHVHAPSTRAVVYSESGGFIAQSSGVAPGYCTDDTWEFDGVALPDRFFFRLVSEGHFQGLTRVVVSEFVLEGDGSANLTPAATATATETATATATGTATPTAGTVPVGPVTNLTNGHNYYLLPAASWADAETLALSLGGHLVTINDAAENAWVATNIASLAPAPGHLWIGLEAFDAPEPRTATSFQWVDGDASPYRNWRPGEPNLLDSEFCTLAIGPGASASESPGEWVNLICTNINNAVVEVP